jgi:Diguanylate cyclase, GGDEF domain
VIEHRANSLLRHDEGPTRFALAFLDIDNFTHINDYCGHPIGDALLVEVAKRLGLDLRDSDMLSRISGDEFMLSAGQPGARQSGEPPSAGKPSGPCARRSLSPLTRMPGATLSYLLSFLNSLPAYYRLHT